MPITLTQDFTKKYEIRHLPKEKYTGFVLRMDYTTDSYYDVVSDVQNKDGWAVSFVRKNFSKPVTHTSAEYNYPDKLYQQWYPKAFAWGIFKKEEEY